MCRIWGISYGDTPEKLTTGQIARIMFPALVGGGPHAYGWMQNVDGETVLSNKYVGRSDTVEALNKMCGIRRECKWIVAHTRYATHGTPKDMRNNHPILHGNIMGVHNGVLRNHEDILAITGREDPATEVDSEAIFAAVNRWGLKKGLDKVHGNMVSVFTDFRKLDTLWIARSYGRHLRLGWTDRGNLIFASEEQALRKLEAAGIVFTKISGVSENRLLTVVHGELVSRITYRFVPVFTQRSYVPFERPGDLRIMAGPSIGSSKRMKAAKAAMEAEHSWHRPHYSETGPVGQTTREQFERHLQRKEIVRYIDDHAGDDNVMKTIAAFLDKHGYIPRGDIRIVLNRIGMADPKNWPQERPKRSKKGKRRTISVEQYNTAGHRVDTDSWEYKGKLVSTEEYLKLLAEDVQDSRLEDWEED